EHPGLKHADSTFVSQSAPEIALFKAQVDGTTGCVSQSAQWPFNNTYKFMNNSQEMTVNNTSILIQNSYSGEPLQQAMSYVAQASAPLPFDEIQVY
ncbi:hypothetical protein BDP27DRAFT_1241333, partial [Rhodocollybia butyracea]